MTFNVHYSTSDTILFDTEDDAKLVLKRMKKDCDKNKGVKINQLYIYSGMVEDSLLAPILRTHGWRNLDPAFVIKCGDDKWTIAFPPIESFESGN